MNSHARWALAALAAVVLTPATTAVQSRPEGPGGAGANWTYFGGDMNNTRYSTPESDHRVSE